jgi:trimethylamine:corrinoid methyltransferase-like protein
MENFKRCLHFSPLMNRLEFARWKEAGSASFAEKANRKVRGILASHRVAEIPPETRREVRAIVEGRS